jgi:uncharacterized protein YlaI
MSTPLKRSASVTAGDFCITCGKCGHIDFFEKFTSSELFGELPVGHFQCPSCHKAIAKIVTRSWLDQHGRIMQDFEIRDVPRFL